MFCLGYGCIIIIGEIIFVEHRFGLIFEVLNLGGSGYFNAIPICGADEECSRTTNEIKNGRNVV